MITENEIVLARKALAIARESGASKARITLNRSEEDMIATLNGSIDRITHCADRSMSLSLFADNRYGCFSTNKLDEESLREFIAKAVSIVRVMAEDGCRDLPDPARCCKDALTGGELSLTDPSYGDITAAMRRKAALDASIFGSAEASGEVFKTVSEEGEYSDSLFDTVVMDTNGLFCRHSENSFDYGVEVTVEAGDEKHTGYWWDSSCHFDKLDAASCGRKAIRQAAAMIGSSPAKNGKRKMVVSSEVASKFVSPVLRALNAFSIQQNNSFLIGSVSKKMFHEGMNIVDRPRIPGQTCSKYFDSEGVATSERPIIKDGVVSMYFTNTYMSHKMDIQPTIEEAVRPVVLPWPAPGLDRDAILKICSDGILVTDFNGGNCNPVTGDFSYGIEGFLFRDGKIVRPVSEMLVTGNLLKMWNNLLAAGDDARPCMSKLIPTLAFSNIDFNG